MRARTTLNSIQSYYKGTAADQLPADHLAIVVFCNLLAARNFYRWGQTGQPAGGSAGQLINGGSESESAFEPFPSCGYGHYAYRYEAIGEAREGSFPRLRTPSENSRSAFPRKRTTAEHPVSKSPTLCWRTFWELRCRETPAAKYLMPGFLVTGPACEFAGTILHSR